MKASKTENHVSNRFSTTKIQFPKKTGAALASQCLNVSSLAL